MRVSYINDGQQTKPAKKPISQFDMSVQTFINGFISDHNSKFIETEKADAVNTCSSQINSQRKSTKY